jgi:hypothetical protein
LSPKGLKGRVHLSFTNDLGAVYTYEFVYESAYDSVYDLVPKVDCNRIWDRFFRKCVNERLLWVYDRELKP